MEQIAPQRHGGSNSRDVFYRAVQGIGALVNNPRIRGEAGWVTLQKVTQFLVQFVSLALLTKLMSGSAFGEFSLAMTSLTLLAAAVTDPIQATYLRGYHTDENDGSARDAGLWLLRRYGAVLTVVLIVGLMLSWSASSLFGLEVTTIALTSLLFVGNRWRFLGIQVLNVQRHRKRAALQAISFQVCQLILMALAIIYISRSASAALLGAAVAAWIFALIIMPPLLRQIRALPPASRKSEIRTALWPYGVPLGLLRICQWIQGFADRYVLAALLGKATAGQFIAAFQVCGVPYMMMWFILEALMTPILFQRVQDAANPQQLRSALRVFSIGAGIYVVVGLSGLFGYFFFGNWVLVTMTTKAYSMPTAFLLLLALGRFIQCLSFLLDITFMVRKRTGTSLAFRALTASIAIPVLIVSTNLAGLHGAVVGSLIVHTIHLCVQCFAPSGCVWATLEVLAQGHRQTGETENNT